MIYIYKKKKAQGLKAADVQQNNLKMDKNGNLIPIL
jgi:hypothetical protein